MGRILYFECNSGISGDMTVGALLDLGADREKLEHVLESMQMGEYQLHFGRTQKCGLDAYDFDVILEEGSCETGHGKEDHFHRNLMDIQKLIDRADTNDRVRDLANKIFLIVARAESKAHGLPLEKVHFHEVGAIDSIIDIMGTAVCLDDLGIDRIVVSPLSEGYGTVTCQHGVIPVPVPATANIAMAEGLTLHPIDQEGEMVTPTGAAIAAAIRTEEKLPAACRIRKIGLGAGNKDFPHANVLRAMILEEEERSEENLWVLESNIDDSTGEMMGFAMEMLFEAGALDVWYTPIYMKKNRPACKLSVLCREERIKAIEECCFMQTSTIGIRRYPVTRTILERQILEANTIFGKAKVKICSDGNNTYFYPEFEDVRKICRTWTVDYKTVYTEIIKAAQNMIE